MSREENLLWTEIENAIEHHSKMKIGQYFYYTIGTRFGLKEDALRKKNAIDKLGYVSRIKQVEPTYPRFEKYEIWVRRKK